MTWKTPWMTLTTTVKRRKAQLDLGRIEHRSAVKIERESGTFSAALPFSNGQSRFSGYLLLVSGFTLIVTESL